MPDPFRDEQLKRLLLAAGIGLAIFLLAGLVGAQPLPPGEKLEPRRALEVSQAALGRALGDHALVDTRGEVVRLAAYRGKPLVVSFVYTGCFAVCPATSKFLAQAVAEAQRALGRDAFRVITVGFNLPFDTPAAMREFQRRQSIDLPGWSFLAGDEATVTGLARDVGFAWAPTAAGFDHLVQATIVDGSGRVFRQVYGESFELPMLVAPLRELTLGTPAPAPSLADLVERVRVLCTVYDPRAGRYRLNYGLFIEIFAGLSMLGATGWYMWSEWRRQRRMRAG
jgi:protein SCO1/2